jgi:capsular exopolysaccharide synthesis family protein
MNDVSSENARQALDTWQVIKNRIGPIILSFILVFATAAIITYIMPRKYRGRVEMRIERVEDKVRIPDPTTPRNDPLSASEIFIKTEFETLTKTLTLYPVIDELNLVKKWNLPTRREAFAKLFANLDPQLSVKSDFVIIEYYDEDPQLAADIANRIAKSYMQRRIEGKTNSKKAALMVMKKQMAEYEQRVLESRSKMVASAKAAGIDLQLNNFSVSQIHGATPQTSSSVLSGIRDQEHMRLRMEVMTMKTQFEQLENMTEDQLIEQSASLKLENPLIMQTLTSKSQLMLQIQDEMGKGYGKKHPRILALTNQLSSVRLILLGQAKQHVEGLRARLITAQEQLKQMDDFVDKDKKQNFDNQDAATVYHSAKIDVEQNEALLLELRRTLATEETNEELTKSAAQIWQEAEPELAPAKPKVALNLGLGGALGLLFGLMLAFALEYLDTSVKSMDDVERFLGVPVLAVIPQGVGLLHRTTGFNPDAEAYRILRTNIEFNRKTANANCITVVSGGAGEGKSTTLTNLAFVCAQGGYNVLLIDADLRRPRLHTLFDASNAVGLTNYLTQDIRLEDVVLQTPVDNLYFLPSGVLPADGAGILNSQRMSDLIADVKSRFDLVLIDSPPILGVSDASVLANEADMTIIVVQHRKLPRQMLLRVKQAVENVGGNVLGVVLNNVDIRSDSQYSYYTSYYTYYSPTNMPDSAAAGAKKKKRGKKADYEKAEALVAAKNKEDLF